jgi:hypothetical protein
LFTKKIVYNAIDFTTKKIIMNVFFTFFIITFSTLNIVPHVGSCGVAVLTSYSQNVLGKNIGYYVELKNNSGKTVDAIEWKAKFYNNFNDYKGSRKGDWSAGNFINPVKKGGLIKDLEGVWVDGASKIVIEITRVHYTDGKNCSN